MSGHRSTNSDPALTKMLQECVQEISPPTCRTDLKNRRSNSSAIRGQGGQIDPELVDSIVKMILNADSAKNKARESIRVPAALV